MKSSTEKRTQIYLTAEQHKRAMDLAGRQGRSFAGVVREALERFLSAEDAGAEADWTDDRALELIGSLEFAPLEGEGLNEAIDRSVYE